MGELAGMVVAVSTFFLFGCGPDISSRRLNSWAAAAPGVDY
jgi:hypothetical protein